MKTLVAALLFVALAANADAASGAASGAAVTGGSMATPDQLLEAHAKWFFDQERWQQGAPNAWPRVRSAAAADLGRDAGGTGAERLVSGIDVEMNGTNEPASAINAINTNQVAYASAYEIRVSTDAGAVFQPAVGVIMTGGEFPCGDSTLGYDSRGRLFWSYLGCGAGISVYIAQVDPTTGIFLPGYPVNVTDVVNLPAGSGHSHDKEWLAIDRNPTSPYRDRLYLVWTEFVPGDTIVWNTWSADQGLTWSPAVNLSSPGEGFRWPVHNTVAPNGDYLVAYHSQVDWNSGTPDGLSGKQVFLRSFDGGSFFPQKNNAFAPGRADITFNVQNNPNPIPGTVFWLQGSLQPYILADPHVAGRLYMISNDDPDNDHSNSDHAHVYIVRSDNNGGTWGSPRRVDTGPAGTFQVIPAAAIDPESGAIVVTWYDNRNNQRNTAGNFLLDVFGTTSFDKGLTFAPEVQINDVSFDPDPGAPVRWNGPPRTYRIGEYNNVDISSCFAFAVWCGNVYSGGVPVSQQTVADTPDTVGVPAGGVGNGLRAARSFADVSLSWPVTSVTPPLYNVHRGVAKQEIDKSAYSAAKLVTSPSPLSVGVWTDSGAITGPAGEVYFYEVFASDCEGNSVIP